MRLDSVIIREASGQDKIPICALLGKNDYMFKAYKERYLFHVRLLRSYYAYLYDRVKTIIKPSEYKKKGGIRRRA